MDANLHDFLRKCHPENTSNNKTTYSHVSFHSPNNKWQVPSRCAADFWKLYCQLAQRTTTPGKLSLGERSEPIMPVLVRANLSFHASTTVPQLDDVFVLLLVACYQQAIHDIYRINDDYELTCCTLTADTGIIEADKVIRQLVLQFPYCRTDVSSQVRALRPRVIQLLRQYNVVDRLKHTPTNDWETILDTMVPQDPWPMYKSTLRPNHPLLLLDQVYNRMDLTALLKAETSSHGINIDANVVSEEDLVRMIQPQHHNAVTQGIIPESFFDIIRDEVEDAADYTYWLPMFLSINFCNRIILTRATDVPAPRTLAMSHSSHSSSSLTTTTTTSTTSTAGPMSPVDMLEEFLPMLDMKRCEQEHFWLDVGRAIYNVYGGNDEGLHAWVRFTERSDVFTVDKCKVHYVSFDLNNALTIKTIAWYAREDSPDLYNDWHNNWCRPALEKAAAECLDKDVADALYHVYWLDFICAGIKNHKWYQYRNHRWNILDDAVELKKCISGDFVNKYERIRTDYCQQIQESADTKFKQVAEKYLEQINNIVRKLKRVTFKSLLVKESMEHFYVKTFNELVDSNENLMGVFNGVVETCATYATVRPGKPEDYISKCCNVSWNPKYTWQDPVVQECREWLHQIFTDEQLLRYFLKLSGSCLRGRNSDKLFPIFTGEGNNSKSMLKKLFEATFGDYCIDIPISMITATKTNQGGPTPEMAQAKAARLAFFQEPDSETPMRGGTIKEITGGDSFFARNCGENGGKIEAMFKVILCCNKVPMIPSSDRAIMNRLRIVPFLSEWVDNPPADPQEQMRLGKFKKNRFFEKRIPALAPAFLWILIQFFAIYVEEGLDRQPEMITVYTDHYWEEHDVYRQFINEMIETVYMPGSDKERDPNAKVNERDMFQEFTTWFRQVYPGTKPLLKATVVHELSQRLGKATKAGWAGIRIRIGMANADDSNYMLLDSASMGGMGGGATAHTGGLANI